jgi:hypothetical protein
VGSSSQLKSSSGGPCIAITQNYVSKANIPRVQRFLRDKRDQVSGCSEGASLFERFGAKLKECEPHAFEVWERANQPKPPALWEQLSVATATTGSTSGGKGGGAILGGGDGGNEKGGGGGNGGGDGGGGFSFGF